MVKATADSPGVGMKTWNLPKPSWRSVPNNTDLQEPGWTPRALQSPPRHPVINIIQHQQQQHHHRQYPRPVAAPVRHTEETPAWYGSLRSATDPRPSDRKVRLSSASSFVHRRRSFFVLLVVAFIDCIHCGKASHGRWNRGSKGSSCSSNFWHGRAGHSSCSPKSLSLLHCDVKLSRIDLDILEFCRSVGRSRTTKLSASGGLRPLTSHQGLCPWTPLGAPPPDPVIGSRSTRSPWPPDTACSPNFQILPTPMFW